MSNRRAARDPAFHAWTNPFTSPRWAAIAPHYAHLALVPPPQCGAAPQPYEPAVWLAARHGLTVNAGVVARADEGARRRYCAALDAAIDAIGPHVVIPMHYFSPRGVLDIEPVDTFLECHPADSVTWVNGSELELTPESLPAEEPRIYVLEQSR